MRGLNDTCSVPSGPFLAVSRLDIAIDGRGVTVGTHFFFNIHSKTTTPHSLKGNMKILGLLRF